MALSSIIFDLDGVVLDTEYRVSDITAQLAQQAGYTVSPSEVFVRYAGLSSKEKFLAIAAQNNKPLGDDVLQTLIAGHRKGKSGLYTNPNLRVIPNIEAVLNGARERGVQVSIASSNGTNDSKAGLETVRLRHRFMDNVYGSDLVGGRKKPDPAVYHFAINAKDIEVSKLMIVEDSVAGVTAAAQTGAFVCAYLDPRLGEGPAVDQRANALAQAGVSVIVRDMKHLVPVIKELSY